MIPVVAGVIYNSQGEVLIARRPDHLDQGGLWEFPGGKIQAGETVEQALKRELWEELGIIAQPTRPLIRVTHSYPHQTVLLDVWQVEQWHHPPYGREGQMIHWSTKDRLGDKNFPEANQPIITAIQLPSRYLITPEPRSRKDKDFFYHLEASLDSGLTLLQLRAKHLSDRDFCHCAERSLTICQHYSTQLLVNATPEIALSVGAAGVHLNSTRLMKTSERPLPKNLWVATSCHSFTEIEQANQVKVDFAVLSPVKTTASHPETDPLGWLQFFQLTESAKYPVFALGGMKTQDIPCVWAHGGQGIAAIRSLWKSF
ncbi:MAG: hypothetical protein BWK79_18870 [Beggiatoa sp. IS2]|nr:MAG: hypothetical protein BWK79_18870 [Beggiatoa sp. IS2]